MNLPGFPVRFILLLGATLICSIFPHTDVYAENEPGRFELAKCDCLFSTGGPVCGNGILESGEQCEPGLYTPVPCAYPPYDGGSTICAGCQIQSYCIDYVCVDNGEAPDDSHMCSDEMGQGDDDLGPLSGDTNYTLVSACSSNKCERICNEGYVLDNGACVHHDCLPVGYIFPPLMQLCQNDDQGLYEDWPYNFTNQCRDDVKCELHCPDGYWAVDSACYRKCSSFTDQTECGIACCTDGGCQQLTPGGCQPQYPLPCEWKVFAEQPSCFGYSSINCSRLSTQGACTGIPGCTWDSSFCQLCDGYNCHDYDSWQCNDEPYCSWRSYWGGCCRGSFSCSDVPIDRCVYSAGIKTGCLKDLGDLPAGRCGGDRIWGYRWKDYDQNNRTEIIIIDEGESVEIYDGARISQSDAEEVWYHYGIYNVRPLKGAEEYYCDSFNNCYFRYISAMFRL